MTDDWNDERPKIEGARCNHRDIGACPECMAMGERALAQVPFCSECKRLIVPVDGVQPKEKWDGTSLCAECAE